MFFSCKSSESDLLEKILRQWNGKEIMFPEGLSFSIYGEKDVDMDVSSGNYKIVHYIDSVGCTSCRLNLDKWKEFIAYMDSTTNHAVSCLLFIHAVQKREVKIAMKESSFDYPVCLDLGNEFYRLNRFPLHPAVQTFLLDKENRIVAMGDPVSNPRVKELYLDLINGKRQKNDLEQTKTVAEISSRMINFGSFHWKEKQDTVLTLLNKGNKLLVVHDISTSCGCTVADYDKRPVLQGKSLEIKISYKADRPESFNKTVVIHCNSSDSPIMVHVRGNAKNK